MSFRDKWLQLSCFFIGYDFNLLMQCSELSKKAVRKYSSAMILVMLIWGFVGYSFSNRYLGINAGFSLIGAFIGILVIIQIERQIILSNNPGWKVYLIRTIIAVAMALIGALIIDQIIFKNDLEVQKKNTNNPSKSARSREINEQFRKDSIIICSQKETRENQLKELENRRNSIKSTVQDKTSEFGIIEKEDKPIYATTGTTQSSKLNPEFKQISDEILATNLKINESESELIKLNSIYKDEITRLKDGINQEAPGFIEELNLMLQLIQSHGVVLFFWILWIVFLLGIELFILFSKASDGKTDYEKLVEFQTEIREERMRKILENNAKHLSV
jgi:hypothetical protein